MPANHTGVRVYFQEPLPTMPHSTYISPAAYSITGREVDWPIIYFCLWDLFDWGHYTQYQYNELVYVMQQYQWNNTMPGTRKFICHYAHELVTLPYLIEGLWQMYTLALNAQDLTDDEEENLNPMEEIAPEDVDLLLPWPINIYRYSMLPLDH